MRKKCIAALEACTKKIKEHLSRERGAFAIDAIFGITLFMLSILAIMLMSLIIRVQANMQYAVDQTAKELSSYYYLLSKTGVAQLVSGSSPDSDKVDEVNKCINNVLDFSKAGEDAAGDISSLNDINSFEGIGDIAADNYEALHSKSVDIWDSVKDIAKSSKDDPVGQVKAILSVYAHTLGNSALSYYVTPFLCKSLMPKYLSGDLESTNKYLESIGIDGGLDGDNMDFTYSSLLEDGRSVNIDVIYKLNTKKLTFGLIDTDLCLHQSASTAAWVKPEGNIKTIVEAYAG